MSTFPEHLAMWNMLSCAEQVQAQIQKNTCIKDTQNSMYSNNDVQTSN